MIKFDNVVKKYRDTRALDNFSWHVNKGEIHGLLGHNGSGKTTSFLIANKITTFDEGNIKLFNKNLSELNTREIQKIGLLTERLKLYKELTIKESLNFFCDIFSIKNKKEKIEEIAHIYNFDKYINKRLQNLSTGMYKKIAIAITFINNPDIVFLDEPFSGLDPVIVKQISKILKYYNAEKKTTIVVSSHNLHEIEEIADRITIMKSGKEVVSEKIGDLYNKYQLNRSYYVSYIEENRENNITAKDELELTDKLIQLKKEKCKVLSIKENKVKLTDIYNKIYN